LNPKKLDVCTTAIFFRLEMILLTIRFGKRCRSCVRNFVRLGSYLTMETSLAIDTLPNDEYEDGPSGGHAQLLGVWGVAAFLGSALGPMIGGPLLYVLGSSDAANGQDYSIHGYAVVLSLSTVYFLLSAVSLRWVQKRDV
jgi:hypothetical protein